MVAVCLVVGLVPPEYQVVESEHIESGHTCHHRHPQAPPHIVGVGCYKYFVLREETCKREDTRDSKTAHQAGNACYRHILVQATHLATFIRVYAIDYCTCHQEQTCLEHGVCEQVEH